MKRITARARAWTFAAVLASGVAGAQPAPALTAQPQPLRGNPTFADKAPEHVRRALQQRTNEYEQAFNAHDGKKMAEQFTADASYLDLDGNAVAGKANIQRHLQAQHAGIMKDAQLQLTLTSVRTFGPRMAILDCSGVMTGTEWSKAGMPARIHATVVAAKEGRSWKMEALRAYAQPEREEKGVGGAGKETGTGGSGRIDPTAPEDSTATPPSGMGTSPMDQRNQDRLP